MPPQAGKLRLRHGFTKFYLLVDKHCAYSLLHKILDMGFFPPFVDRIVSNSLFLLPSHIQPHSSGASSGGHPGSSDQALPGHEQRGLPVHISKSLKHTKSTAVLTSPAFPGRTQVLHIGQLAANVSTPFLTSQSLRASFISPCYFLAQTHLQCIVNATSSQCIQNTPTIMTCFQAGVPSCLPSVPSLASLTRWLEWVC